MSSSEGARGTGDGGMRRLGAVVLGVVGLLLGAAGCNQIGGITEGVPRGDDPVAPCSALEDCAKVEAPECRVAVACEEGLCRYGDAPDGSSVRAQAAGDCALVVCDGAGSTRQVADVADVPDDGKVCTFDACDGARPTHTFQPVVPCYTGPAGTEGKGICVAGTQQCDAQGNLKGACNAQVLPEVETCASLQDEDCDGQVNEEGDDCKCVPGSVAPCYTGAAETAGVGSCHDGTWTCNADGLGYGMCMGEQKPQPEACDAGAMDEDCDGQVNEEGADCKCGDGYLSAGEACDDGNLASTDACTELCQPAACGDGFLQAGVETCEDGNADDTDACPATCVKAFCGDGFVHVGVEPCDDGNADETDACHMTCVEAFCGDGFVHVGVEACDDGNADGTDACLMTCVEASCGDGFVQAGVEVCDDGNADSADDCTVVCTIPVCGDGFLQPGLGEECDDGGTSDGDPCSPTCEEQRTVRVTGGLSHTCALLHDGRVKCWGYNDYGQLGLGDTQNRGDGPNEMGAALPSVDLGAGEAATAIAAGDYHTCALLHGGDVKCWGRNDAGQLGLGDTNDRGDAPNEMGDDLPAIDLGAGKAATAIAAGALHTCALLSDGGVKCWGHNVRGQLGLGDTEGRGDGPNEMGDSLAAVDLGAGKTASSIAAGSAHTCAVLSDGGVKCWGYNNVGQLGLGSTVNYGDGQGPMGDDLPAVDLGMGTAASAIATGDAHTCALLSDGAVKCWGFNNAGQLGLGDTEDRGDGQGPMGDGLPAVDLGLSRAASAIIAGDAHTCALLSDGAVKCWGFNNFGQLGLGNTDWYGDGQDEMGDKLPGVDLGVGKTAAAMGAGYAHTCAVLNDGSVKCWGYNAHGQLGQGNTLKYGDKPGEMGEMLIPVRLFSDLW